MTDTAVLTWVTENDEPWTLYRAHLDLDHRPHDDPAVLEARDRMLASAVVRSVLDRAAERPGHPLKRHNDAGHPLYTVSTLAGLDLDRSVPAAARSLVPCL